MAESFWETNLIYRVVIGSQAYGLANGASDLDTCGREVEGRYKFPDHDAEKAYRSALKHWNHYQAW